MDKLQRGDLFSLEEYAEKRKEYRDRVIRHKQTRQIAIGPHVTLLFEDRLTIQYQVQEMLRIEKTFGAEGINEELQVYNPMIPDGCNWKATMMLEFEDPSERAEQLARLVGIENAVWMSVAGENKIYAVADEDLERTTESKTSAVHFLRFELDQTMIRRLKQGAGLSAGIDHPGYRHTVDLIPEAIRLALLADLD
ncbi:MAG TPA: DUF3501 family protein [Gammaproteobacteria bacterium]|nr:DUF3501 family protein [Gammaproteobacteria bacterium]